MGIIDILTEYGCFKSCEYLTKSVFTCSQQMSCIPPTPYQKRFIKFMKKNINEINDGEEEK